MQSLFVFSLNTLIFGICYLGLYCSQVKILIAGGFQLRDSTRPNQLMKTYFKAQFNFSDGSEYGSHGCQANAICFFGWWYWYINGAGLCTSLLYKVCRIQCAVLTVIRSMGQVIISSLIVLL